LSGPYVAIVTTHVLAAMVWIGGMLFFALAAPILRGVEDERVRAGLFDSMGRRFRAVGWVCVAVLLATGVTQLRMRGWWGAGFWSREALFGTRLGMAVIWKLLLVTILVAVQAVHDFWLGPRAGQASAGSYEALRARSRAAILARVNAGVALALVYVAVRLGRG